MGVSECISTVRGARDKLTKRRFLSFSTLKVGEPLTVPTRLTNGTLVEGNIAQCATVISGDIWFDVSKPTIVAGQYSLAAVDGSNGMIRSYTSREFH